MDKIQYAYIGKRGKLVSKKGTQETLERIFNLKRFKIHFTPEFEEAVKFIQPKELIFGTITYERREMELKR